MSGLYALCEGAGLQIFDSCRRLAEHNPKADANPYQARIPPTRSARCPSWVARPPHALTPTDRRN